MLAHCVTVRDPFHPDMSREMRPLRASGPIRALAPATAQPFVILRNGQAILRADWDLPVEDGDLLAVVLLPQGGGGSNPLKLVLMLAVTTFAPQLGALAYESVVGAAGITSFGSSMAQLAGGLIGSALVNAIIPPPKPPSTHQSTALAAPSPTYSLSAQGNMARLDQAIPVQYGRMMCFPDFAAQPYVEYAGDEQYLYQLLCIGQGEYDIHEVRIEDTPVASFAEIEYETIGPGGTVTKFPTNVNTSNEVSGQEMLTATYLPATDGYVANASGTQVNALGLDFVTPRGLYRVDEGDGHLITVSTTFVVEARTIDDNGLNPGAWVQIGSETISAATTTPKRISKRYAVALGRYQVRVKRTDTKQTSQYYGHELAWAGLRAYMPETRNFGNVTLLAMRMRASNNLSSQASRKINVICTRKLPIWNGSTWSAATATKSIAWALADACKNTTYGGKLPDSRIDLAGLLALDAIWAARGDEFNGRFDNALSFWEAITKIAGAGRAKPFMQGGIVRVMRDAAVTVPVAMFGVRNIVRGSFNIEYILPSDETADAVDVAYFDAAFWAPRRVRAKLPDSSAAKPVKVDLFGVTDRNQAFREGMYQAASNRYRRRLIKFSTEMEGFIPSPGDLIIVQHDMPAWGQFAEVVGWNAGTLTLTLSEPMTFDTGAHYIGLRKKDGGVDGPYQVVAGANAYELVLSESPAVTPYAGSDYERTHVAFGWAETWRQTAKVVAVRPRGLYEVEIEAINEDPSVHTAETGQVAPPVQTSQLTTMHTTPGIANLTMASSTSDPAQALLSWTAAPGADSYQIEMASGTDPYASGLTWTRVGETSAANFALTALYGAQTLIRVRAVGLAVGGWVTMLYGESADYMWVVSTDLMWDTITSPGDGSAVNMWRY